MNYVLLPEHQAILLNFEEAVANGAARLSEAATIEFQGKRYTALRHGLRETQALRRLGISVPSPMGIHYGWPKIAGLHSPFTHQKETSGFATLYPRCYILNDIGTGKTYSALWAADYLMQLGIIDAVVILSPLSALRRAWADSIFETFPYRTFAVLHGTAEYRRKMFDKPHDFYIINHEGFNIIRRQFAARPRILVIIDELSLYRNRGVMFDKLRAALRPVEWVWGMTGGPVPHEPTDAWAQTKLITPDTTPSMFTDFRMMTMNHHSAYVWTPRREALDIVYKAMRPAIRFTRDQCLDLPACVHSDVECEMSADQTRVYKEMARDLVAEWKGGTITAANAGVKVFKLIQIACGILYGKNGEANIIGAAPRLSLLNEQIDEAPGKAIVFVPFRAAINMVAEHLSKSYSVAVVHGDVTAKKRDVIFNDFQKRTDPRVLVADAGTMSHSLTLTEASLVLWYGPEMSNDVLTQANGRLTRQGQHHVATIKYIQGCPAERKIYKTIRTQGSMQSALLRMIADGSLTEGL